MADHAHQRILEAVQAVLVAASTAAGSRVYLDRVDELPEANLPAIDILGPEDTGEDSIEVIDVHGNSQQHAYSFAIRCVAAQASGAAKAARNLAKQVHAALLASSSAVQVGTVSIGMFIDASAEIKSGDTAVPVFAVRQQWQAQYITAAGAPDVPL